MKSATATEVAALEIEKIAEDLDFLRIEFDQGDVGDDDLSGRLHEIILRLSAVAEAM